MKQDDYQKKIDEHRQSIGVEEDMTESRRSRRSSYAKKTNKKAKNLLLPTLFFIFILIPVCIFIYVQFFYTGKVEDDASPGVITVETKPISNTGKDDNKEDNEENKTENVEEQDPKENLPETEIKEDSRVEEPKNEQQKEQQTEPKTETKEVSQQKTHIVQANETLYRIAINYYKDPNAVEKIRAANGLKSNSISAGQKLILP
jgi:LysM repeat protein